tara:strand:- start:2133 stop:3434 length:1302 start_codon:yes stop_codon:yes gene_type:complete
MSFIAGLSGALTAMGDVIGSVTTAFTKFGDTIGNAFNSVKESIMAIWDTITSTFSSIGEFLSDPLGYIEDAFIDNSTTVIDAYQQSMGEGLEAIAGDKAAMDEALGEGFDNTQTIESFEGLEDSITQTEDGWQELKDQFEDGADVTETVNFFNTATGEVETLRGDWTVAQEHLAEGLDSNNFIVFQNEATGEIKTIGKEFMDVRQMTENGFEMEKGITELQHANSTIIAMDENWQAVSDEIKEGMGFKPEDQVFLDTTTGKMVSLKDSIDGPEGVKKAWEETALSMEGAFETKGMNDYFDNLEDRILNLPGYEEFREEREWKAGDKPTAWYRVDQSVATIWESFSGGGISKGPESGYLANLHGTEAVVPLPDGKAIPVDLKGVTGSPQTFNITINAAGITDRTDKRQMARDISNQIQKEVARSLGVSTTRSGF